MINVCWHFNCLRYDKIWTAFLFDKNTRKRERPHLAISMIAAGKKNKNKNDEETARRLSGSRWPRHVGMTNASPILPWLIRTACLCVRGETEARTCVSLATCATCARVNGLINRTFVIIIKKQFDSFHSRLPRIRQTLMIDSWYRDDNFYNPFFTLLATKSEWPFDFEETQQDLVSFNFNIRYSSEIFIPNYLS